MKRVAVIGLGSMGMGMAKNLVAGLTGFPDGDNWCIVQLLERLAGVEAR